jgi:phage-related holin
VVQQGTPMNEVIKPIGHYNHSLCNLLFLKLTGAYLTTLLNVFLGDISNPSLHFILVLVFLDTLCGLFIAWKFRKISSWGLRDAASKLIVYLMLLIISHASYRIMELQLLEPAVIGFITTTELVSLIENLYIISPNSVPWFMVNMLQITERRKLETKFETRRRKVKK